MTDKPNKDADQLIAEYEITDHDKRIDDLTTEADLIRIASGALNLSAWVIGQKNQACMLMSM